MSDPGSDTSGASSPFLSLARLDARALGSAAAVVIGAWAGIATLTLYVRGGEPLGPHLTLLGHYFWGYSVTPLGSLIGALYAGAGGFVCGSLFAWLRNRLVHARLRRLRLSAERRAATDLLERIS